MKGMIKRYENTDVAEDESIVSGTVKKEKHRIGKRYADLPKAFRKGKPLFLICMLAIPLAGFFVFYVGVNFTGILLAFQVDKGTIDGVRKYAWSLEQFSRVWDAVRVPGNDLAVSVLNTLKYFMVDSFGLLPLSFLISYYFSKKIRGYGFLRVLIFIPSMMSSVAVVTMYKNMLAFNGPLAMFFEDYANPLMNEKTATNTILFYHFFFGISTNVLLFQGALNRIPPEIIDSAQIDGANTFQEIVRIIIPLIMTTLSTIVLLNIAGLFAKDGPILVMTNGAYKTSTIGFWIYLQTVEQGNYNMPAALGLCLTVVSLPIVYLANRFLIPRENIEY